MGLHSVEELVRKHRHDEDTMRVRESEESGLVFVFVLKSAVCETTGGAVELREQIILTK